MTTEEELDRIEHDEKYWSDVPDPDDPIYQINFPIDEKSDFDRTPTNLRAHFIHRASPLIDDYIDAALGNGTLRSTNDHARFEVWSVLKQILLEANNPSPLVDIRGKSINEQVDKILTLATTGKINNQEAKEYLELIRQGYEVTEVPNLMKKLEALEALGVL